MSCRMDCCFSVIPTTLFRQDGLPRGKAKERYKQVGRWGCSRRVRVWSGHCHIPQGPGVRSGSQVVCSSSHFRKIYKDHEERYEVTGIQQGTWWLWQLEDNKDNKDIRNECWGWSNSMASRALQMIPNIPYIPLSTAKTEYIEPGVILSTGRCDPQATVTTTKC